MKRHGRGKLSLGDNKIYRPEISSKLKSINSKLKKEFPFLDICLWNSSTINEFMVHQPAHFYILIEVEKEAVDSVFFFLKEKKYSVLQKSALGLIEKYFPHDKEHLLVKSLVTEAPLQNIQGIKTVSIEKILVDIFCEKEIFSAQQGSEMRTIFNDAMSKYAVNENRMLRYADRRRKKDRFKEFLNSISNIRQQN